MPSQSGAAPVNLGERIAAIDIIRGFALFGVLWMNLHEHRGLAMPYGALDHLPTAWIDKYLGAATNWLMQGKAQCLFSLLFGFGFANIMSRLEARGLPAGRIFLRRIGVLMLFGLINAFLLFVGDILVGYALMGFVLYFTRRWSMRRLLLVGLPLTVLSGPVLALLTQILWDGQGYWNNLFDEGARIRGTLFLQSDPAAYVGELWRANWVEWYGTPPWWAYVGQILGRFMLGSWMFRKGWFTDLPAYRDLFRKTLLIALPTGLALSGLAVANAAFGLGPAGLGGALSPTGALLLASAYASAIVLLHMAGHCMVLFAGLAAVGRMALTNYIMQSLFYIFAVYGFGLGLMAMLGATLSLGLAVALFALQIAFSRWWLSRYRFGPLEWIWRCLTYGQRQPMRLPHSG